MRRLRRRSVPGENAFGAEAPRSIARRFAIATIRENAVTLRKPPIEMTLAFRRQCPIVHDGSFTFEL
jgi:hypothetical protein